MIIIVKDGTEESPFATEITTIGELFQSTDFVEDNSVPGGAIPTLNGQRVGNETAITSGSVVGWDRPVSDKG